MFCCSSTGSNSRRVDVHAQLRRVHNMRQVTQLDATMHCLCSSVCAYLIEACITRWRVSDMCKLWIILVCVVQASDRRVENLFRRIHYMTRPVLFSADLSSLSTLSILCLQSVHAHMLFVAAQSCMVYYRIVNRTQLECRHSRIKHLH